MIPFFRKSKKSDPAPEWTPFSNLSEYEDFISLIKKYFARKKVPFSIEEGAITADGAEWPETQMGLYNLAQLCKQKQLTHWKSIINEHFDGLLEDREFNNEFQKKAHDYAYAAPYIGVRIYPNDYFSSVGDESTIKKSITKDLSALLVLDFPRAISTMRPEMTIQWNKTNEELYEIGLANMRMKYPTEVITEDINGNKVWFIQGDHLFVTNSILELQFQPVPSTAYGSLIGIPHRHCVMVYPIEDTGVLEALQPFIIVLQGMHREGPGSISQNLYWYKNGQLTILPYDFTENEIHFKPPEEFVEMMNLLEAKKR